MWGRSTLEHVRWYMLNLQIPGGAGGGIGRLMWSAYGHFHASNGHSHAASFAECDWMLFCGVEETFVVPVRATEP
eukprot:864759-Prymnesium_polylepis.1